MRIDVLTLFPAMFEGPLSDSMMGAARLRGLLDFHAHDIRNAAEDAHRSVDDTPYGGGGGMILRVDVLTRALEALQPAASPVILLSPQGRTFTHRNGSGATRNRSASSSFAVITRGSMSVFGSR